MNTSLPEFHKLYTEWEIVIDQAVAKGVVSQREALRSFADLLLHYDRDANRIPELRTHSVDLRRKMWGLQGALPSTNPNDRVNAGPMIPSGERIASISEDRPLGTFLVLDDFFPNLTTGFRVAEYNAYIHEFERTMVLSTVQDFVKYHSEYAACYPIEAEQIFKFRSTHVPTPVLAYVNFLNNAMFFLPWLEKWKVPFCMTLYPGGGFALNTAESDDKLERVLRSANLKRLIVTQHISGNYVESFINRKNLKPVPITYIIGIVANPIYFANSGPETREYFGKGKPIMDVCFVAEKYMQCGANKGFPEFVTAASSLIDVPQIQFHVVGGFSSDDVPDGVLHPRIKFHGRLETSMLRNLCSQMDLVVSLSKPNTLYPGNFDGFPTGTGVEASLCGAALIASDALGQNPGYTNGNTIFLVELTASAIEKTIRDLMVTPEQIGLVARSGRELTRRFYSPSNQITPRIALMEEIARDERFRLR